MTARVEGWYPVALERDVVALRVARSRIGDTSLVLWRDDEEEIHVWADHCPHRSVRLSAGRNFGGYLEDIYHGWRFGKDGRVIGVPAEGYSARPDVSAEVEATTVQNGLVFATLDQKSRDVPKLDVNKNEVLIRPLPIRARQDSVSLALSHWPCLKAFVTPTGESSCWVYGWLTLVSRELALDALRRINGQLNDLRRALESGS